MTEVPITIPGPAQINVQLTSTGPQGPQGPQGDTGGPQGPQGAQGAQGIPGTGITLLGSVPEVGDLPASGNNVGDLWIVQADGHGYAWDGAAWNDVGLIQGPQGDQGATGAQGVQGSAGATGPQGSQGATGATGPQGNQGFQGNTGAAGPQGDQGDDGATGPQGAQGATGAAGPQGDQGDDGAAGPQGFQGATGAAGPQGSQGAQGNQGAQGVAGTGITLLGSVPEVGDLPASGNNVGDLWIVEADGHGYAWDGAAWNDVGLIQGPQGNQGATGAAGPQGDQGFQGPEGNNAGLLYNFSTTTTDADPGDGVFRFNNATISAVTEIYIDLVDQGAVDHTAFLDAWDDSTSALKGFLQVDSNTNSDNTSAIFSLSAVTTATGYRKLSVAHISGIAPADTEACVIQFFRTGDLGATGPQGNQGFQGNQGNQGFQGATGAAGPQGDQGDDGAAGPQGDTGATGPQGAQGAVGSTGPQGAQGNDGATGPQGAEGNNAGLRYNFSSTTTDADPGSGIFRLNNSTVGSVTEIYIDLEDQGAVDHSAFIDTWDDSTNSVKGHLLIDSNANADDTYLVFQVNSVTTATGYRKIGVTYLSGALPSNNEPCTILFTRAGNQGTQGPQGDDGAAGPQGNQGFQGFQGTAGGSTAWKGDWDSGTAYIVNDAVAHNGSSYICIQGHTNEQPPNASFWNLLAQVGATGPQGNQGFQGFQGTQGNQGFQGTAGAAGNEGNNAGLRYNFSTTTTDSDPGNGVFRFNNATVGSVTQIFIDANDQGSNDQLAYIDTWDDSTNSVKGHLLIDSNTNADDTYLVFQVNSVTTATGYRKIGVTYLSGALPSDTEACTIIFVRSGDQGAQGSQGFQGNQGFQGTQGNQGFQGFQGTQGAKGDSGGVKYNFSTTTTDADPGNGNFRFNNATVGSVTQIFIDLLDAGGVTQTTWLDTWANSTNTVKGHLLINSNDPADTTFLVFQINSVTTATGYRKIGVTYQAGALPSNAEACVLVFSRAGDVGAQGFQGNQGFQGTQGNQGFQGAAGAAGSEGNNAGLRYNFSTTTTDSDPGNGVFRFNNATVGSVTQIFIDANDQGSNDQLAYIDTWDDSSNTVKGHLLIDSNTNADDTYLVFQVNSVTTATGYRKIGVTYLSGALPSNAEACTVIFVRTGDQGAQGNQGNQGNQGFQGTQGNQGFQGTQGNQGNQGNQGDAGGFDDAQTINAQTGTTYTLVLTDAGKLVTLSNASAIALTVPPNSSVAFATGTHVDIAQLGAGQVTAGPGSGVTINSRNGLKLAGQYAVGTLIKIDTNTWLLAGDVAT